MSGKSPNFFLRFIAKKVCAVSSRTSSKIVPLTNLSKYLYNGKSAIKVNVNKSTTNTATIGELITTKCASVVYVCISRMY